MRAHAEPLRSPSWLIRVYVPACSFEDGDPYELTVVAEQVDVSTVEIKGLDKQPSRREVRAIDEALARIGMTHRVYERRDADGSVRVRRKRVE